MQPVVTLGSGHLRDPTSVKMPSTITACLASRVLYQIAELLSEMPRHIVGPVMHEDCGKRLVTEQGHVGAMAAPRILPPIYMRRRNAYSLCVYGRVEHLVESPRRVGCLVAVELRVAAQVSLLGQKIGWDPIRAPRTGGLLQQGACHAEIPSGVDAVI